MVKDIRNKFLNRFFISLHFYDDAAAVIFHKAEEVIFFSGTIEKGAEAYALYDACN